MYGAGPDSSVGSDEAARLPSAVGKKPRVVVPAECLDTFNDAVTVPLAYVAGASPSAAKTASRPRRTPTISCVPR
jgi:hypothetical protein